MTFNISSLFGYFMTLKQLSMLRGVESDTV